MEYCLDYITNSPTDRLITKTCNSNPTVKCMICNRDIDIDSITTLLNIDSIVVCESCKKKCEEVITNG
jgi:hypothetical protein